MSAVVSNQFPRMVRTSCLPDWLVKVAVALLPKTISRRVRIPYESGLCFRVYSRLNELLTSMIFVPCASSTRNVA